MIDNISADLCGISQVPDIFLGFPFVEHVRFVEVLFKITLSTSGLTLKLISFISSCNVDAWLPNREKLIQRCIRLPQISKMEHSSTIISSL